MVNYIRRMVATAEGKKPKNVKVGHTGTLDPLATGLLVILVGKEYTRRAPEWNKLDKTYEATMRLGQTSTTGDEEGEKTAVSDRVPADEEIAAVLQQFTGDLMQTPPVYSAMKIDGVRAYKLARQGQEVVLEPRPTKIYSNELVAYEYPFVRFTSRVSSGTYIRSLVEDMGKALGTGAYMSGLRRTQIGDFDIADAVVVETLQAETLPLRQIKSR
ncbi:MAG TPA: tRNA pseudouridine(55) synthase TruB [Candidatus Saccharimonadales bacterium]|nr:tRNA pseudouridine(55) synthase TruB [Candidatus Saccharimonadales bacterium]